MKIEIGDSGYSNPGTALETAKTKDQPARFDGADLFDKAQGGVGALSKLLPETVAAL
jgi:hypothetical protein